MPAVLHDQLIARDRDLGLSSRQLVGTCVFGEAFRRHFEAAKQMPAVALIFAYVLEYFRVRCVGLDHTQSKRFGEGLRILEGHLQFQVSEIRAPEAFREFEGLRLGGPAYVEPAL